MCPRQSSATSLHVRHGVTLSTCRRNPKRPRFRNLRQPTIYRNLRRLQLPSLQLQVDYAPLDAELRPRDLFNSVSPTQCFQLQLDRYTATKVTVKICLAYNSGTHEASLDASSHDLAPEESEVCDLFRRFEEQTRLEGVFESAHVLASTRSRRRLASSTHQPRGTIRFERRFAACVSTSRSSSASVDRSNRHWSHLAASRSCPHRFSFAFMRACTRTQSRPRGPDSGR